MQVTAAQAAIHMAYVAQQRLDGYDEAIRHTLKWKATFDKRVLQRHPGEVVFTKGQLVQVYPNDLDYTFKMEQKLLPKWSQPHRVTERLCNSYQLKTLTGHSLTGLYNARQLRVFVPKEGSPLHIAQQEYMQQVHREGDTRVDRDIDEEGEQATADDDDDEPEIEAVEI